MAAFYPVPLPSLSTLFDPIINSGGQAAPLPSLGLLFNATGTFNVLLDNNAFTFTGNNASILFGKKLACSAGSYSFTGVAVTLDKSTFSNSTSYPAPLPCMSSLMSGISGQKGLTLDIGSYTLSGKSLLTTIGRKLTLNTGTYTFLGAPAERDLEITNNKGIYNFTGNTLTFNKGFTVTLLQGNYTFTGQAIALSKGIFLSLNTGSYVFSGKDVTLFTNRNTDILDAGSYMLTGKDATLRINRLLVLGTGTYTFNGKSARLRGPNDPPGITVTTYSGLSKSPKERESLSKPIHVLVPLGGSQYDITKEPAVTSDKTPSTNYEGYDYDDN